MACETKSFEYRGGDFISSFGRGYEPVSPPPPPPQPPQYGQPSYSDYRPNIAPSTGLAMTGMILGIVGLLCGPVGIVGLILGIVALSKIGSDPMRYGGRGMAITGIVTGAVGAVLIVPIMLIAILLPSLGKARELANRSTCSANLRGITQSMNVYAADGDVYPLVGKSYSSTLAASYPGPTGNPDILLSNTGGGLYNGSTPGNVCQSLWILVLEGQVAPKQFLCKSDPAGGTPSPTAAAGSADYYSNFKDDKSYSYSFAFMWANGGKEMGGWWHSDTDAGLPLIADMAPANGTGSPAANTLDGMSKNANSFNHQRDGQCVGFGDGHAEFMRTANGGESNDNIYSANGKGGPSATGTTPASAADPGIGYSTSPAGPSFGGSRGNWDVCLVPAADGTTYTRK